MTIESTTNYVEYDGDNSTTAFAFNFKIQSKSDLQVALYDPVLLTTTIKTLDTHYTVTGTGNTVGFTNYTSGTVTFTTAPTDDYEVQILRKPPLTNVTEFTEGSTFPAKAVGNALDKAAMIDQYLQYQIDNIDTSGGGGGGLEDGDYGDITVSGSSTVLTIDNDAVTYAKMQNVSATDKLLGRVSSGSGNVEEVTCTDFAQSLLDDTTASAARTTLGLVIGTDVQAYDAELAAIAGLTSAADKGIQFTGSGTAATFDLTAAGKALLDDVDAAAQRTTLGLGTLATQSGTSSGTNTGDQNTFSTISVAGQSDVVSDSASDTLTLVAGANVTITTNAGTDSITIAASGGGGGGLGDGDYGDITVSGTSTVMTIDNDVVTYAKMQNVSATDKLLGRSTAGSGDVEEIACTAAGRALLDDADASAQRTTLGLGTISTQSSSSVSISGGSVTGITDISLADGGTGASLADPNADRIMFWDDSAGTVTWLTAGTGLTITDTTISASGSMTTGKVIALGMIL